MSLDPEYDFNFKLPFYRHTIKPIIIKDYEGNSIGSIQRSYNNVADRIVDAYLKLANKKNFKVDLDGQAHLFSASFAKYKDSLFRDKWYIYSSEKGDEPVGLFTNKSKVNTNPRFHYEKTDKKFLLRNDLFDKNIYIEDENKQLIAMIYYERITSMRNTFVSVKKNVLDYNELLLLAFIFTSITD